MMLMNIFQKSEICEKMTGIILDAHNVRRKLNEQYYSNR